MLNYWEAYSPEQMAIQSQKLAQTFNLLLSRSFKSVSLIARVKRSGEAPPPTWTYWYQARRQKFFLGGGQGGKKLAFICFQGGPKIFRVFTPKIENLNENNLKI